MAQPLLSIGMIVKNEIRCIEKCLKALQLLRKAIPCELVIADTGSTDGTRAVAERYADIVFDFPWINDFSAARNAVLDKCTGKWFLAVDADEYLDPDFSQLTDFLTGPEADQYTRAAVNQYNYSDWDMKGDGRDFLAPRMARLDMHPRYTGTIHESFPAVPPDQVKPMLDVKLHHNGYAYDPKHDTRYLQKMTRNLTLLEHELMRDPQDLRRLLQCMESSGPFPARQVDYTRQAMKSLLQRRWTSEGEAYGPTICSHALQTATAQKMPELIQWQRWSMKSYPESIYLQIDGNLMLIKYYFEQKKYEEVPALLPPFLLAWENYRSRNFNQVELFRGALQCSARKFEVYARAAGAESLARMGRLKDAATLLVGEPDWEGLRPAELVLFLSGCTWAAGEESLQGFVAEGAKRIRTLPGGKRTGLWEAFCSVANTAFQNRDSDEDAPECPWRLFSKIKGGLGQAVQIMEGDLPKAQAVLPQIKEWEDVPGPAVVRAVELGPELPDAFFAQSRERLAGLATQISEALDIATLLEWESRWDFTASMARFQFLFELLAAALRADKTWEEETEGQLPLCDRFLDVAGDYLPSYYNQELLTDEVEWTTLPGLHRFALHLLKGREAQAAGDELGCVRSLRAALKAAPAMKKAVSFLMDQLSKPVLVAEPSAELLALAEQVRTILSRYSDDDPAVVALKQSDVYKKVAYLIEGTGTPAFGGLPQ